MKLYQFWLFLTSATYINCCSKTSDLVSSIGTKLSKVNLTREPSKQLCDFFERRKILKNWFIGLERDCIQGYSDGNGILPLWIRAYIEEFPDTEQFYIATGKRQKGRPDYDCSCAEVPNWSRENPRIISVRNDVQVGRFYFTFVRGNFARRTRKSPIRIYLRFPYAPQPQPLSRAQSRLQPLKNQSERVNQGLLHLSRLSGAYETFLQTKSKFRKGHWRAEKAPEKKWVTYIYGYLSKGLRLPDSPEAIKRYVSFWQKQLPVKIFFATYPVVLQDVGNYTIDDRDNAFWSVNDLAKDYLLTRRYNVLIIAFDIIDIKKEKLSDECRKVVDYIHKLFVLGLIQCLTDIHFIGFYVASHIAGLVANKLRYQTINGQNLYVKKLTAFSPVPFGELSKDLPILEHRLSKRDAEFVQVINAVPEFVINFANIEGVPLQYMKYEVCIQTYTNTEIGHIIIHGALATSSSIRSMESKNVSIGSFHSFDMKGYWEDSYRAINRFRSTIHDGPAVAKDCVRSISRTIRNLDKCEFDFGPSLEFGYNITSKREGTFYYPNSW